MSKNKRSSPARRRGSLPRVLVIEANPGYRSVISHVVELAGGQFESVAEVEQGWRQLDGQRTFDIVIVGVGGETPVSPDDVGRLRTAANCPLIVVAESYDSASGTLEVYEAGADQVLPKPFVPDALIGAIKSEIRRPGPPSVLSLASKIEVGSLVFEAQQRRISGASGAVSLTKREWQLLTVFLGSPNQFMSADDVALQAWGPEASVEQFRSYITRLRQKLLPFASSCEVVTERGKGYSFVIAQA
jgi:DNA-binding response OmpR family regulator